jgi:hypothetical protein
MAASTAAFSGPALHPCLRYVECSGKNMGDSASAFAAAGHAMIRLEAELPIVMCFRCGAWGNRRTRRLAQPCGEPTKAGRQALRCIAKGQHPLLPGNGRDTKAPRARARGVDAYDPTGGTWVATDAGARERGDPEKQDAEVNVGTRGTSADVEEAMDMEGCRPESADIGMLVDGYDHHGEASEDDVFGHGGRLDQDLTLSQGAGTSSAAAAHSNDPTATTSGGGGAARRTKEPRTATARNYTAEIIGRIGAALKRSDTNPRARMENLRRRVADRAKDAEQQHRDAEQGDGDSQEGQQYDAPAAARRCKRGRPADLELEQTEQGRRRGTRRADGPFVQAERP